MAGWLASRTTTTGWRCVGAAEVVNILSTPPWLRPSPENIGFSSMGENSTEHFSTIPGKLKNYIRLLTHSGGMESLWKNLNLAAKIYNIYWNFLIGK